MSALTPLVSLPNMLWRGAVAQFGRAPRSQCGGPGFESPLLHQNPSILNYLQDRSKGLEFPNDQYVTKSFCLQAEIAFGIGRPKSQPVARYLYAF